MMGLTWGDPVLQLSPLQWGAVLSNCAAWLYQWRTQASRPRTALLTCGLLWWAFWNVPVGRDTALLFEQAHKLQPITWSAFLATFYQRAYLEFQTPFFPWYVSRFPVLWMHQIYLFPVALLNIALLFALYAHRAAWLCATPLFALMSPQPSTDILLFAALLCALRLCQMQHPAPAALVYGVAYLIKPLILTTAPVMVMLLGPWFLLSVSCWAAYVVLSLGYPFGQHQAEFLMHQLLIQQHYGAPAERWQVDALTWRWRQIGQSAISAAPWYLFPAWLGRWQWLAYVLAVGIVLGYGNLKYFLMLLGVCYAVVCRV